MDFGDVEDILHKADPHPDQDLQKKRTPDP